jgi:hypothetical protein
VLALQQDLPELVAQLQLREQLVVTLEPLLVQQVLVQLALLLVQLALLLVQLAQEELVLVQLEQELLLVVAPLELVEHPCLPKNFGAQK